MVVRGWGGMVRRVEGLNLRFSVKLGPSGENRTGSSLYQSKVEEIERYIIVAYNTVTSTLMKRCGVKCEKVMTVM
jgi:hypothetical protein